MKPGHTYAINPPRRKRRGGPRKKNPVPFALVTANPKRRRKSKKAGVFIIRKPTTKNPAPVVSMKTKRRRSRRKNSPISNLGRFAKRRRKARRNPSRRRKARRGSPKIFIVNPMKKSRRRRSRGRSRNPMKRRGGYRRNVSRRSSRRRSRSSYRRNPIQVVQTLFGSDMLSLGAGVIIGSAGAQTVLNYLQAADTAGKRRFSLPGVDYTPLATTGGAAAFYEKNAWVLAGYKLLIAGGGGWLLRNQSPRLARGIMLGAIVGAATDVLNNTGMLSGGAFVLNRGTSAYFGPGRGMGRGMAALTPGVSPTFTGPGAGFLNGANGAPMSRGMGRALSPAQTNNMIKSVPNFAAAN
jgi:hypothetical protein